MKKTTDLTAFKRILGYVWPQWRQVLLVVGSSLLIAVMFTVSFMTVLPLLKVMMGDEGLHGWVDRKTVEWRYGLDLVVPDLQDYAADRKADTHALRVLSVADESLAATAGLRKFDRIVAMDGSEANELGFFKLLERLAAAEPSPERGTISLVYTRPDGTELRTNTLTMPIVTLEMAEGRSLIQRLQWWGRWQAAEGAAWLVSFLPRDADIARSVIFIILGMSVVTVLRCFGRFYQTYLADKITLTTVSRIREDVFAHTMYMPVGFFSNRGTSDTTSRIIGDVAHCGKGVKVLLGKTLREPLKAIGTLTAALMLNWQLTLIFIGAAPLTVAAFGILGRKIKKASKKSLMSNALMLNRIQGAMNALRVVKVYNRQDYEIEHYHATNQTLLKRLLAVAKIERMTNPLMEVLGMIAGSAALVFGAFWMSRNQVQPEEFLTLLVLLGTTAESIRKVSDVWNEVQGANAAAERVFEVMDQPRETEDPDPIDVQPLRHRLEFRDIVFTYPDAAVPALNGVNLSIQAGQTVAIVGGNGSGKSTLVNLIPRFYDPDRGQILIDGQDIHRATLQSLREQISMVTQNVMTFNDTIACNIAYGKPDATMDEIVAAARQAYAHEFIEPLPDGYETVIGENSAGFSGGQLQRMVIARAILKNPPIMIFDEAMSQVDADSEMKIHKALSVLMEGRTCLLIAHRFSTVISADSIAVMDAGRIVAQGKHEDLIQNCAVYKRLYETQLMGPA
jgi:ATP-binding cassette, subfamily B, bacterial MsbA